MRFRFGQLFALWGQQTEGEDPLTQREFTFWKRSRVPDAGDPPEDSGVEERARPLMACHGCGEPARIVSEISRSRYLASDALKRC